MHYGIRLQFAEEQEDARAVTYIQLMMYKVRQLGLEPALIPARITPGAKELSAPVVVDAVDLPTFGTEIRTHLGTNETR
jgi:hypothetical protein